MGQRAETAGGRQSYNNPCTIARALDVLGDRWTLLVLRDLMAGLQRYSDILASCTGMSPNVLSDRLKRLEAHGLVSREYFKELPPRVEYTLTDEGREVRPILLSLLEWGHRHLEPPRAGMRTLSADFIVRTTSAFTFQPELADGVDATMVIEIKDCEDCNTWSFEIRDGQIRPRRQELPGADIRLKTTNAGFFRFIRGELPPEECGELVGSPLTAARIQACFVAP